MPWELKPYGEAQEVVPSTTPTLIPRAQAPISKGLGSALDPRWTAFNSSGTTMGTRPLQIDMGGMEEPAETWIYRQMSVSIKYILKLALKYTHCASWRQMEITSALARIGDTGTNNPSAVNVWWLPEAEVDKGSTLFLPSFLNQFLMGNRKHHKSP